jgi:hypothetical protein
VHKYQQEITMASVKRVIGNDGNLAAYDIYANPITFHGNINIVGNTTTVSSNNTVLNDNIIVLNAGETGAGITLGNSGIMADRGSSANAYWVYSETDSAWEGTLNGSYINVRAASPVANSDVVTKGYLLSVGGTAAGASSQVQYNNGGLLLGNANFTFNNGNLKVYNTTIGNGNVTTSGTNQDLVLYGNGAGTVNIQDVLKLSYQASAPSNVASTTQLFANTVGAGGTGLYVVNSGTGDELITKTKATVLALIFG